MANRLLRSAVHQKLLEALAELHISNPPSNSQLARFRLALRRASRDRNGKGILDHLRSLKTAKHQFEQARIHNIQLSVWLGDGMEHGKIWEDWLQPASTPSIAPGTIAQPTDELKIEYTVRLLDALFKRAAKESGERGIK